jgi:hypothetical protein
MQARIEEIRLSERSIANLTLLYEGNRRRDPERTRAPIPLASGLPSAPTADALVSTLCWPAIR